MPLHQIFGVRPRTPKPLESIPVGTVIDYAGATEPTGWLFCYGQAISRATYAALFAVIGTTYGAGDGSSTFNLPDMRGRFLAGKDNMGGTSANRLTNASGGVDGDVLGAAGGAETHTLTEAQMPSHSHSFQVGSNQDVGGYPIAGGALIGSASTANAGSGNAHNNIPPVIIVNKIIKQ